MTHATPVNTPLVLIIRDGWGENPHPAHAAFNAIEVARSRGLLAVDDRLRREWPGTLIKTSGEDVGLPDGTMGNSEVGHQNIGAGRIVEQESRTMTRAVAAGFDRLEGVRAAFARARSRGGAVHLLCIASDAGVHGLLEHLYAFVRAGAALGQREMFVHLFSDGRDSGPRTGAGFAGRVEAELGRIGVGRVASVCGRYFAMDRDHRWERVKAAYDVLTGRDAAAPRFPSAVAALEDYYARPAAPNLAGDEFVPPRYVGEPAFIRDGDSVIFVNYRGDRPRELCAALCFPDEAWARVKPSPDSGVRGFDRGATRGAGAGAGAGAGVAGVWTRPACDLFIMTEYWEELLPHVAGVIFRKPAKMADIGGQHLSALGLRQFRCAETEKYPHVTFFFNDYRDEAFAGEQRENPQSPRVATYDLQPEMNAHGVRDAVLARLAAPGCEEVLVVNFANGDMVGHTGSLEAAVKACACVDACVGRVIEATLGRRGTLIITADHGNAEQMFDPETGSPHTAHTTYDVPLHVVGEAVRTGAGGVSLRGDFDPRGWFDPARRAARGRLGDIFPTALALMGLPQPAAMTGRSLLLPR